MTAPYTSTENLLDVSPDGNVSAKALSKDVSEKPKEKNSDSLKRRRGKDKKPRKKRIVKQTSECTFS